MKYYDVVNGWGLSVGTISKADYDKIRRDIYKQKKLYFKQLIALIKSLFCFMSQAFYHIPLLYFWYFIAVYIGNKQEIMSSVDFAFSDTGLYVVFLVYVMIRSVKFMFTTQNGFQTVFSYEIGKKIAKQFHIQADSFKIMPASTLVQ